MSWPLSRRSGLDADVAIVGGGPAGAAAAITLARAGRRVVLIDKSRFPRDKCCGDGLTVAALRRLEGLGLDPASVASWEPAEEAVVRGPDGRRLRLPLPSGRGQFAAAARRVDLDAALVDLAAANGAEVIDGTAVVDVVAASGGAGVAVRLATGPRPELRSSYVVAADGMWSTVRRAVGVGQAGYLGEWQAGREYVGGLGPLARKLWVWFEPDMAPGYAWSFPLAAGTANVGYGVLRRPGAGPGPLRGQRIDLLARPHIAAVLGPDASPIGPWKSWPIPSRIGATALTGLGGRVLFAGDAARASDPMTGEGIAQALETAELAARLISWAGPSRPETVANRYRRHIRWGLAVDDRLGRDLSKVLAHPRGTAGALRIADSGAWLRGHFARWMFEDYPRAVIVTPHRWHRHLFTRPGAFASPVGPPAAH
jgi:geranylgeranyl reductase family protein